MVPYTWQYLTLQMNIFFFLQDTLLLKHSRDCFEKWFLHPPSFFFLFFIFHIVRILIV